MFATLSYLDVVNHAQAGRRRPALFSAGLSDAVTPPSTVFAAYHHYAGPKDIAVYPFGGHEGARPGTSWPSSASWPRLGRRHGRVAPG